MANTYFQVLQVQTGPAIGINTLGTTTISIPQQAEQLTLQPQQQATLQVQTQAAVTATATTATATTAGGSGATSGKKKKRKKRSKDRKTKLRPGEIRLGTALDGSPLYMCPECHVAYPEPELLTRHRLQHSEYTAKNIYSVFVFR